MSGGELASLSRGAMRNLFRLVFADAFGLQRPRLKMLVGDLLGGCAINGERMTICSRGRKTPRGAT
eukprot:11188284-Lingulodinium_polyedra.AAC.1